MNKSNQWIILPPSNAFPVIDEVIVGRYGIHTPTLEELVQRKLDKTSTFKKRYRIRNPEERRAAYREYYRKLRQNVLELLGDECIKCGFNDARALQIDHVNGDGAHDKRSNSRTYYKRVTESILAHENRYQLLCSNCNWIKRAENDEHGWKNK